MDLFFEDKKKLSSNQREEEKKDGGAIEMKNKKPEEEKKYESDNLAEGNEKAIEDKLNNKDPQKEEQLYHKNIEYDMSIAKKQLRMKVEDKHEMEKVRRWIVKIYNIYITPLSDMFDPFLQFTIGGDFQVEVYRTKSGDTYKIPKGTRGYSDKTEVQENVDKLERRPFDKVIDIEMRMSYSMINKQKIMVEVWDYNTIWMNKIQAYSTMQLMDIVSGNCNTSMELTRKESGKKKPVPFCCIEFKCIFQEIWDFKLSFLNWKAGCILPPKKKGGNIEKYPNSQVEISLVRSELFGTMKAISEEAQNTE